jgi:hypothetical protein
MKSPIIKQFFTAVKNDVALQKSCAEITHISQLEEIAQLAGFDLTVRDLQLWAHDRIFLESWWPWANADSPQRSAFFRG